MQPLCKVTFFSMQSDSLLQEPWLITGVWSDCAVSCHTQAASEEVNTHLFIEGVLAHASITFSATLTSISAIDFYKSDKQLLRYYTVIFLSDIVNNSSLMVFHCDFRNFSKSCLVSFQISIQAKPGMKKYKHFFYLSN